MKKRKTIEGELKEIKIQQACLKADFLKLLAFCYACVECAENKSDLNLIAKTNSLWKSASQKTRIAQFVLIAWL